MKALDLTGQRFNRLTAIKQTNKSKTGKLKWLCQCDCGNTIEAISSNLKNGQTNSCGCYHKDQTSNASRTHGQSKIPEYKIWKSMTQRCFNSNQSMYNYYGGRGILICDRWLIFENFIKDMGLRPSTKHGIERQNNDGNYEPANCKWATPKQQANNRRSNYLVTYQDKTQTLTQWCNELNIPVSQKAIWHRLEKLKWSPEKAFTEPSRYKKSAG